MTTDSSSRSVRRSAGLISVVTLFFFAIILGGINWWSFRHYIHKDWSQSQFYTFSPKTKTVLRNLDAPVTITTILSDKYRDQIENLLKEYQRVGGKNITVEKIDPAYDMARASQLQKRLHFEATDFLIIFEYKDRSRFLKQDDLFETNPTTGQVSAFKGEQQFTSAINSLVEGKSSKVYFTEGHGEHLFTNAEAPNGYGMVSQSLKSENVETAPLNLATDAEVPSDAQAVIIAGPSISFSPIEEQALEKYLAGNGKLFILLDPYVTLGLDNLLKTYGLKYEDDLVLYRAMTNTGTQMTIPLAAIYQAGFSSHPITAKFSAAGFQLLVQDARSITPLPDAKGHPLPQVQPLLQTDATAWGWLARNATVPTDPRALTFNRTTDLAGPLAIAAAFDGGMTTDPATKASLPGTRLVVVGCAKFLENDTANAVAVNFFTNAVDWLVKKDAILEISPKQPQEYGVSLSPMQLRTVIWCALIFIPAGALSFGLFIWFSRRK